MDCNANLVLLFLKYCAISTGVLFYWRGTWILLDSYLFPDNLHWSAWSSLLIGILGITPYHSYKMWLETRPVVTQESVQEVNLDTHSVTSSPCEEAQYETVPTTATADVNNNNEAPRCDLFAYIKLYLTNSIKTYYFGFVVVNAWRGLWFFQDLYIVFPDTPMLSPWISHIVGIFVLMVLSHFQSMLGPPYSYLPDKPIPLTASGK